MPMSEQSSSARSLPPLSAARVSPAGENPSGQPGSGTARVAKAPGKVWFTGLNALRFYAAFAVVLMHIQSNMDRVGLPSLPEFPILFKGLAAVSFFFTLSGFLITYLLLQERARTGTVGVKAFYWRRVFRIWPLYFIVVAFGLLFYNVLVPRLGQEFAIEYPMGQAVLLYAFFGANLLASLYHVGGILHVTWSIAVEEQFYLGWAPLFKHARRKRLLLWIAAITVVSLLVNTVNGLGGFGWGVHIRDFVHTLQFHYMGIGAGAAWMLYHHKSRIMAWPVFARKGGQWIMMGLLLAYFLGYTKTPVWEQVLILPLGLAFAWLILNTAANPGNAFRLSHPVVDHLGKISYGIYMYHMIVVYAVSFAFSKIGLHHISLPGYFLAYYAVAIAGSFALAQASYRWVERPLLCFGHRFGHPKNNGQATELPPSSTGIQDKALRPNAA